LEGVSWQRKVGRIPRKARARTMQNEKKGAKSQNQLLEKKKNGKKLEDTNGPREGLRYCGNAGTL